MLFDVGESRREGSSREEAGEKEAERSCSSLRVKALLGFLGCGKADPTQLWVKKTVFGTGLYAWAGVPEALEAAVGGPCIAGQLFLCLQPKAVTQIMLAGDSSCDYKCTGCFKSILRIPHVISIFIPSALSVVTPVTNLAVPRELFQIAR